MLKLSMSSEIVATPVPISERENTQTNETQTARSLHTPVITPGREYGIPTLRLCAETSTGEYLRLLKLQQVNKISHAEISPDNDNLKERVRMQANITLDDLRALESKLSNLYALAEGRRFGHWLLAGLLASFVPVTSEILIHIFTQPSENRNSSRLQEAIIRKVRYTTRHVTSGFISLCTRTFGTSRYYPTNAHEPNPHNVTDSLLPNEGINSTVSQELNITQSSTTSEMMIQHVSNLSSAFLSKIWQLSFSFTRTFFANTTAAQDLRLNSNSTPNISIPIVEDGPRLLSPTLPITYSTPITRLQNALNLLDTHTVWISATMLLLTMAYVIGVELHLRVTKRTLDSIRRGYAVIDKGDGEHKEEELREDARSLKGWKWDVILLGHG